MCVSEENETVVSNENQSEEVISVEYQEENNMLTASIEDNKLSETGYVDLTVDSILYLKMYVDDAMFKTPWKNKTVYVKVYDFYESEAYELSYFNTTNTNNDGLCLINHKFFVDFYLKMWTDSTDEKVYHIYRNYDGEIYVPPNNQNSHGEVPISNGFFIKLHKCKTLKHYTFF